jgi:UDP-4-amino-4,6-dideoxy-N-acetyl-beta-L-altrosamine transaminase
MDKNRGNVKFIPYGRQWIDEEEIKEVIEVLRSDWITCGPKIDEFEKAICDYAGCKNAVAVNSGTSALDIAVQTLDLPKDSEIITTPLTFAASSNAAIYNDCKPVFADIDKDTRNISPESIKKRITDKTRAIIFVDYAGHPCDIDEIKEIAEKKDIRLIEDACHSIGAEYKGARVGQHADMTVYSFHPVKQMTTGEGGCVVTDNSEYYEKLKLLRSHGIDKNAKERSGPKDGWAYDMKFLGKNYRMTDFQAALGITQLRRLDGFIKRRHEIAREYNEAFNDLEEIEIPKTKPDVKHSWHIYTVLLKGIDRDVFYRKIKEKGIGVNVHYIPVYRFSYYKENYAIDPSDYPTTEDVFSRIITLPLFPKMSEEDVTQVIDSVKETLGEMSKI